ncbi:MAG: hypothetical protein AB7F86_04485 [Bdellovibrionales bacterium]
MRVSLGLILFLAFLRSFSAGATEYSTINSSVRALGMGDAYTALADDSSSLFYNPAGLARVSGINWKVISLKVGASGYTAYNKIKDLNSSSSGFSSAVSELYGEHVWSGAGGESIFTIPFIGFGVYDHADALIKIDNPVYPEIYTSVVNDFGYVLGIGVPIGPFLQGGVNLKYIKRTGARVPFGASFVADLDPNTIYSNVTGWGTGYGADIGGNIVLPAPFFTATLSAVWKNVGEMTFTSEGGSDVPKEENDITLGAGLLFDLPLISIAPAFDFRYLNRSDLQLTRKINFGIEIGLPIIDIRGGFREGYYTAGLGVNLGLFRVDAATYGVELGEYTGQIEDRRYVLEFAMELGIGGGGSSASGGKGGKGGGSGSRSVWGSRKLKRRR